MERFGLVGLPNAGKSSLYNALTGGGALAAPYPFATKDPNIGVAKVPDERLDRLGAMSASTQIVHAAGWIVVRLTYRSIVRRPAETARRLRRVVERWADLPPPDTH